MERRIESGLAASVVRELLGGLPPEASIERTLLAGGLEASQVTLVTARFRDRLGRARMFRAVVKELTGWMVREVRIYRDLTARHASGLSPRLLAVKHTEPDRAYLCIEAVHRTCAWPWRDVALTGDLFTRLAKFHEAAKAGAAAVPEWDFEAQLKRMAELSWAAVDRCRRNPKLQPLARGLPAIERVVTRQDRLCEQLLSEPPFGKGAIHGDVHTGNALARQRRSRFEPILLDWGRARIGSPVEDVSSWLLSLGCWEEEARRRHDKLLCDYLTAVGAERRLTSGIRAAYWAAGARNALAGALLHSICVAEDEGRRQRQRAEAYQAARNWIRVIRRADAWSRG